MRITFLGTGTSHGVPSLRCPCDVCCSPDPRDKRTRCSILVEWRGQSILVDTPPDLREQALRSNLRRIDAILYTHSHADHIFGLDDVRRYNDLQGGSIPVYARPDVLDDIRRAYRYIFMETQIGGGKPRINLFPIDGPHLEHRGLEIQAIDVMHGRLPVTAFRFGDFAYATDVSAIGGESIRRLGGVHTMVLSALRHDSHPTHFNLAQAVQAAKQVGAQHTYFVHMAHNLGHRETEKQLPSGVHLAYDGLILNIPGDS